MSEEDYWRRVEEGEAAEMRESELQEEIDELRARVSELEAENSQLKARAEKAEAEVAILRFADKVDAHMRDIMSENVELRARIANLEDENRKLLANLETAQAANKLAVDQAVECLARVPDREAVARALHKADWHDQPPASSLAEEGYVTQAHYRSLADAVLALFAQETKT